MKKFLSLELWYPMILGIGSGFAHFVLWRNVHPSSGEVISSVTNVSGIAVGFLATAQGLLIGLSESKVVQDLKGLGMYSQLMRYFSTAIHASLMLCLVSLVLSLDSPSAQTPAPFFGQNWLFSCWIGMTVFALASSYRVISLFSRVLHRASGAK